MQVSKQILGPNRKSLRCVVRHAMCFAGAFCIAEHMLHAWQLQTLGCCMCVKPAANAQAVCHYRHCAYVVLHQRSCDHWILVQRYVMIDAQLIKLI